VNSPGALFGMGLTAQNPEPMTLGLLSTNAGSCGPGPTAASGTGGTGTAVSGTACVERRSLRPAPDWVRCIDGTRIHDRKHLGVLRDRVATAYIGKRVAQAPSASASGIRPPARPEPGRTPVSDRAI